MNRLVSTWFHPSIRTVWERGNERWWQRHDDKRGFGEGSEFSCPVPRRWRLHRDQHSTQGARGPGAHVRRHANRGDSAEPQATSGSRPAGPKKTPQSQRAGPWLAANVSSADDGRFNNQTIIKARTLTAQAGPSPCDPYRHALARRRPPRKARPFVS